MNEIETMTVDATRVDADITEFLNNLNTDYSEIKHKTNPRHKLYTLISDNLCNAQSDLNKLASNNSVIKDINDKVSVATQALDQLNNSTDAIDHIAFHNFQYVKRDTKKLVNLFNKI